MEKELVWAKMKGYPLWPGKICKPEPNRIAPKPTCKKWIFFFGSKNYSWIEERNLKPYVENRDAILNTVKNNKRLMDAVNQSDEYLSDPKKYKHNGNLPPVDTDRVLNDSPTPHVRKVSQKKTPSRRTPSKKTPSTKTHSTRTPSKKTLSKRKLVRSFSSHEVNSKRIAETTSKRPRSSTKYECKIENIALNTESVRDPVSLERPQVTLRKLQKSPEPVMIFGLLGVGVMGSGIVKNLLSSGHEVVIWNRDPSRLNEFAEMGAEIAKTPCDVAVQADIIFSCVFDPRALKELVFGNSGINSAFKRFNGLGYIEMTAWNDGPSQNVADAIVSKGGRYLQAQMYGSRVQADDGALTVLATGDRTLYDDCQSCFKAMANNSFFLGKSNAAGLQMEK